MDDRFVVASSIPPSPVEWLWKPRIPLRGVTIVEGDPGAKKLAMLTSLVAAVTTGRPMPGSTESADPAGVVWFSDEDTPERVQQMLLAHDADLDRVVIDKPPSLSDQFSIPSDTPLLEAAIRELNARMVVLDPFESYISGSITSQQAIRRSVRPLARVADENRAAIIMVRHLTKNPSGPALLRGVGSVALIAAARSALLVAENPANEAETVLAHVKSNVGPLAQSTCFRTVPHGDAIKAEWTGTSEFKADDLARPRKLREDSARYEAASVLYEILAAGPVWSREAIARAKEQGIKEGTLRRAMNVLGVQWRRLGYGKGGKVVWFLSGQSDLERRFREQDIGGFFDHVIGDGRVDGPSEGVGGADDLQARADEPIHQDDEEDLGPFDFDDDEYDPADHWKYGGAWAPDEDLVIDDNDVFDEEVDADSVEFDGHSRFGLFPDLWWDFGEDGDEAMA